MTGTIKISFAGRDVVSKDFSVLTSRSVKTVFAQFEFDSEWDQFETKTAIFVNGGTTVAQILDADNSCAVPWEALSESGDLTVGVVGQSGEKIMPSVKVIGHIVDGIYTEGTAPQEPTPDVYEQIVQIMQKTQATAQSVRDDADAGKFDGDRGPKGTDAQIVQARNLGVERAYPRMIRREGSLYLFTDNAFVMSVDGGESFLPGETVICSKTNADDLALCAEDGVTALDTVANATPIVLADGRIAVYYRANNTAVGYASIRVRYLDGDGAVSAPQIIVKKTGLPTGGLWEPFPIYIGDTLYLYYCDSGNADGSQSVELVRLTAEGLLDADPATAISGYTDGGKVRRPGMPSIAMSEGKYYMVVEDNDAEHLAGTGKTVGVELWESEDGLTAWTYRGVMFPEHTAEHSGAPYILAREDGRIVVSFQSDLEEIADLCDDLKHHDRRVFAYESVEVMGDPFERTYAKKCAYRYAPSEAGYWGSLAEINGILYCIFNHGLHTANGYDALGVMLVSDAIVPTNVPRDPELGYVPRSSSNGVVYVRSGFKDTVIAFAADSAKGGTMARRRSDGTIKCADPVNDDEAVPKGFANSAFVPNVASETSGVVYAVVSGKNTPIKWAQANPDGNTIVRRTASGCVICADPLGDRCAATKKYVDDSKKETLAYIEETLLGGAW